MTDFTPSDLRALLEKATPAPWKSRDSHEENGAFDITGADSGVWLVATAFDYFAVGFPERAEANAALIVAAVNALPKLLDQRDKLVEALKALSRRQVGSQARAESALAAIGEKL